MNWRNSFLKLFFKPFLSWGFIFLATQALNVKAVAAPPEKIRLQIWHQMIYSHRAILAEAVDKYVKKHPEIQIDLTYRETEELRSAFQSAAMGGSGPELIYGPSDQVGPFATMGIIRPLEKEFEPSFFEQFDPLSSVKFQGHIYMQGDRVGNHLMLIYNKKLIDKPPQNTNELIALAQKNTLDLNKDGVIDRYGLVWNMTEPFFFVPWVKGFGEHFLDANNMPHLATESTQKAFQLIQKFKNLKIVPQECDYEMANALFKEGKAAMIINGDWSWGDYQKAGVDFGVAPIPMISETGLWPAPLIGTTGYSMNIQIRKENLESTKELFRYLTSEEVQNLFTEKANTLPSNLHLRETDLVKNNALLKASAEVMKHGEPMPIVPEIRAVWDSLRGKYQSVLAGKLQPDIAALDAQKDSLKQIEAMNRILEPDFSANIVYFILFLIVMILTYKLYTGLPELKKEWNSPTRFAFIMMLPAFVGLLLVVLYPFVFNIILSVSNLSLKTFFSWKIIGLHHYFNVITDPQFYQVLLKTILWTFVNLFFHVVIGVCLALLIHQTLPAKGLFRLLLIIPWAVPQYITALTWRGMFNQEYGAINIALAKFLSVGPVQWLSDPVAAFSACIVTNVWLGFPFMMVIALSGLQAIPTQLYEAAIVDGATPFQRFKNITWPLLQPVMVPAITLGGIWTFNNLNVIWLVSNGGEPADQTHILVSYVYKSAFNLYRYGYAAALSVVIFIILGIASAMYLKWKKASESLY